MAFFDIVIVGSGFGGAVMAARLGAYAKTLGTAPSVLVLEKGWDGSAELDPRSDGDAPNAQETDIGIPLVPRTHRRSRRFSRIPAVPTNPGCRA